MRYDKQSRSAYHRQGKAPYKYGEAYHHWAEAVKQHGLMSTQAMEADDKFRRYYGIPPRLNKEVF